MSSTKPKVAAAARANIAHFLASLEPENAPSPPHRRQTGRPAPDLERLIEEAAARMAPLLPLKWARNRASRPEMCPECDERPRAEKCSGYCRECHLARSAAYMRAYKERRRREARAKTERRPAAA